ncbi:Uncharacterised protein [Kingella potus]|uniref:Uncharacterized protein n=1 Tax=Kingella potus TaxID=265175 RepID=A0A377R5K5_9NEIS|nr:Uncharacterised protein [Kingella potus]
MHFVLTLAYRPSSLKYCVGGVEFRAYLVQSLQESIVPHLHYLAYLTNTLKYI